MKRLSGPALVASAVALVVFALFTAYMVSQADNGNDVTWTRLAWIFSSVEAIAFAAAGALFGAQVHRERAEKAEEEARKHSEDAAKGRALAATLKADEGVDGGEATRGLGAPGGDAVGTRHARLARELFPD